MQQAELERLFGRRPDPSAREELLTVFQPLAMHVARRYVNKGEEITDLRQVAIIGLLNAIDRYDTSKGARFTSFAVPTISGELKRHFRDNLWSIAVPRRLKDLTVTCNRASQELGQILGRAPTTAEMAAHTGLSEQELTEVASLANSYRPDSLDMFMKCRGIPGVLPIGGNDAVLGLAEDMDAVNSVIESMSLLERKVLFFRFHHEMTQSQIAERVGVSQMQISRVLRHSLETIRLRLTRRSVSV